MFPFVNCTHAAVTEDALDLILRQQLAQVLHRRRLPLETFATRGALITCGCGTGIGRGGVGHKGSDLGSSSFQAGREGEIEDSSCRIT